MADQGKRLLDYTVQANVAPTDQLVIVYNAASGNGAGSTAQTALISLTKLLGANSGRADPAANNSLTIANGSIFITNNYLYVATANNYLKRVALSTF
jgi:hypothetical protein